MNTAKAAVRQCKNSGLSPLHAKFTAAKCFLWVFFYNHVPVPVQCLKIVIFLLFLKISDPGGIKMPLQIDFFTERAKKTKMFQTPFILGMKSLCYTAQYRSVSTLDMHHILILPDIHQTNIRLIKKPETGYKKDRIYVPDIWCPDLGILTSGWKPSWKLYSSLWIFWKMRYSEADWKGGMPETIW